MALKVLLIPDFQKKVLFILFLDFQVLLCGYDAYSMLHNLLIDNQVKAHLIFKIFSSVLHYMIKYKAIWGRINEMKLPTDEFQGVVYLVLPLKKKIDQQHIRGWIMHIHVRLFKEKKIVMNIYKKYTTMLCIDVDLVELFSIMKSWFFLGHRVFFDRRCMVFLYGRVIKCSPRV